MTLKTGDMVYVVTGWKDHGIRALPLGVVHQRYTKIDGVTMELDRDFFLSRLEALNLLHEKIHRTIKHVEGHARHRRKQLEDLLAREVARAKAESK